MEGTGEVLKSFLTKEAIVEINRRQIMEFGGGLLFSDGGNLQNPGSLEHVLEEIQGSIFGQDLYPSILEKAAILCWRIIRNHVFFDGNKRTGMAACGIFLQLNGYRMNIDKNVVKMALNITNDEIHFSDFVLWLKKRTKRS